MFNIADYINTMSIDNNKHYDDIFPKNPNVSGIDTVLLLLPR